MNQRRLGSVDAVANVVLVLQTVRRGQLIGTVLRNMLLPSSCRLCLSEYGTRSSCLIVIPEGVRTVVQIDCTAVVHLAPLCFPARSEQCVDT
jgi:hypothetical protein